MNNKNKVSTTLTIFAGKMFAVAVLIAFAAAGTAFADNITKSFEFGPGLAQTRSIVRSFPVPCGTLGGVAAVVKFQRLGPDGSGNNLPIIIELREPDSAPDQEGPLVEAKTANVTKTEQTVTLLSPLSTRGCSLPWRVRVKYANDGPAPVQAFGSIRLDFDGRARFIAVSGAFVGQGCFKKGATDTGNLGDSSGLQQGGIVITAYWEHGIDSGVCLSGPNPVKLKIQLIAPNGTVVQTAEGYASNETRAELPKLKLTYQVANRVPGQWKIKFTNIDANNDAWRTSPSVRFTPSCP